MIEGIYEEGIRRKVRFDTPKGLLMIEDLRDLPLKNRNGASLDNLAKDLNRIIKETEEESFVDDKSATNTVLELKFEIVKHVISVKKAENEASKEALEIKAKKELYDGLIHDKELEGEKELSLEDLKKKRAEL